MLSDFFTCTYNLENGSVLIFFLAYRVIPGPRNYVFDPASVFLSTH